MRRSEMDRKGDRRIDMDRIDEIRTREKAATKGPWYTELVTITSTQLQATNVCALADSHWPSGGRNLAGIGHWRDRVDPEADADFIAHAREDIPWLLEQLEQAGRPSALERGQAPK